MGTSVSPWEEVRRENGMLKAELDELSNLDKSRAQLAKELAEVKAAMLRRTEEGSKAGAYSRPLFSST